MVIRDRYLIEIRLSGYAKKYLKNLIFEVSKKFRVKGVTRRRVVPHVTLFGPFTTDKEGIMISNVVSVLRNYDLVPFEITGFSNFDNKVIFVDIKPSGELEELRRKIAQSLFPISKTVKFDRDINFKFHGTVAFKDIEYKFNDIWGYLKEKEESNIKQYLLRVTIVKNKKILCEFDLMQKKLLDRSQSLDRNIWRKTISILKSKSFLTERERKREMAIMYETKPDTVSGVCAGCGRKYDILYKKGRLYYCKECLKSVKTVSYDSRQESRKKINHYEPKSYSKQKKSGSGKYVIIFLIIVAVGLLYLYPDFGSSILKKEDTSTTTHRTLLKISDDEEYYRQTKYDIVNKINIARREVGLSDLSLIEPIASKYRVEDMLQKSYFGYSDLEGNIPNYHYSRLNGKYTMEEICGICYHEERLSIGKVREIVLEIVRVLLYERHVEYMTHETKLGYMSIIEHCNLMSGSNNFIDISISNDEHHVFLVIHALKIWIEWEEFQYKDGVFSFSGKSLLPIPDIYLGTLIGAVRVYHFDPYEFSHHYYDNKLKIERTVNVADSLGLCIVAMPEWSHFSFMSDSRVPQSSLHMKPIEWTIGKDGSFKISFKFNADAEIEKYGDGMFNVVIWAQSTIENSPIPILVYTFEG